MWNGVALGAMVVPNGVIGIAGNIISDAHDWSSRLVPVAGAMPHGSPAWALQQRLRSGGCRGSPPPEEETQQRTGFKQNEHGV